MSFSASYGASGDQSRAVANGQRADYVAFSIEPDLTKLVPAFVADGWDAGPTKGLVSDSVVVIAVRKGNPKHITGWDDLIKPGVKIVTPGSGIVRLGQVEPARRLRARLPQRRWRGRRRRPTSSSSRPTW